MELCPFSCCSTAAVAKFAVQLIDMRYSSNHPSSANKAASTQHTAAPNERTRASTRAPITIQAHTDQHPTRSHSRFGCVRWVVGLVWFVGCCPFRSYCPKLSKPTNCPKLSNHRVLCQYRTVAFQKNNYFGVLSFSSYYETKRSLSMDWGCHA